MTNQHYYSTIYLYYSPGRRVPHRQLREFRQDTYADPIDQALSISAYATSGAGTLPNPARRPLDNLTVMSPYVGSGASSQCTHQSRRYLRATIPGWFRHNGRPEPSVVQVGTIARNAVGRLSQAAAFTSDHTMAGWETCPTFPPIILDASPGSAEIDIIFTLSYNAKL